MQVTASTVPLSRDDVVMETIRILKRSLFPFTRTNCTHTYIYCHANWLYNLTNHMYCVRLVSTSTSTFQMHTALDLISLKGKTAAFYFEPIWLPALTVHRPPVHNEALSVSTSLRENGRASSVGLHSACKTNMQQEPCEANATVYTKHMLCISNLNNLICSELQLHALVLPLIWRSGRTHLNLPIHFVITF